MGSVTATRLRRHACLDDPQRGRWEPRQDGPLVPLAGAAATCPFLLSLRFASGLSAVFATPSATGIGSRIFFGVATTITQWNTAATATDDHAPQGTLTFNC
jgi:hypothetical protein